ncbi:hypothetical protein [Streptomyces sp. NPDC047525]|uniref:hypothetical protein n=1 Tax=Streptomyces sp. NPDC047525 TaxID=3155264 RepID=UPI0033FBF073
MLSFTLDTNCLVALEEQRDSAPGIRALLSRHADGTAIVQIAATTAAENQVDGETLTDFAVFQNRLQLAGMGHLPILKPVLTWDFAYWDWGVWPDDSTDDELRKIHEVLFPALPYDFTPDASMSAEGQAKAKRKWRNYRLDGLGLHTHIQAGGDVYVTSDRNFMKVTKKDPLAQLGAVIILGPTEANAYAERLDQ